MKRSGLRLYISSLLGGLALGVIMLAPALASTELAHIGLNNIQTPAAGIVTSGQPTRDQLKAAAEAGVQHVINLRPLSEQSFDEQALVQSLGMQYHSIPVAGTAGVDFDKAREFKQLLDSLQGQSLLLHCASGNRVGALKALAEYDVNGGDIEDAVATGKRWGLDGLEPVVREKLRF